MKCNRLISLIKDWYIHVQDEAMAPARMVEFMTKHIETCEECQQDPDVQQEAEKIQEIVLPPSKKPKVREAATPKSTEEVSQENEKTEETEEAPEEESAEDDT